MGWGWVDRSARCWGIAGSKILVDLVSDCLQLTLLELADLDPAPAPGRTDECGIHQLQNGPLAKGMRDHLGAPPFLAEQPAAPSESTEPYRFFLTGGLLEDFRERLRPSSRRTIRTPTGGCQAV